MDSLLAVTDRLRRLHSGNRIRLCSIVNARSGLCAEDCAFCAQSTHHAARVERYRLLSAERLAEAAQSAGLAGAGAFSIVTSGHRLGGGQAVERLESALEKIAAGPGALQRCASLGKVPAEVLERLRAAGLECFHHNLEASRSFFPEICTTHSYEDRVEMVRTARATGLRVCSGGIFGMGESPGQRVALALELRALDVDSVPLNFLTPVPGTPLEGACFLTPEDCLRIIAMFRLVLPGKDILVCGGREVNLGHLQNQVFRAGANGIMIGNYLTTRGREAAEDLEMLESLGLESYHRGGTDQPQA